MNATQPKKRHERHAVRQIVVRIMSDGEIEVEGALDDKAACYAMLEMAKDAVREFKKPGVIVAPASVLEGVKR